MWGMDKEEAVGEEKSKQRISFSKNFRDLGRNRAESE